MIEILKNFGLQMFADSGTLVNATTNYVNAYTGSTEAFDSVNTLTPGMKTYYDTELLENARNEHYFAQFGRKQGLPANKGRTVEWRKWNTLPNATVLQEGVIPTGQKMGMTSLTTSLEQYGMYVAITDLLDLHHVDPVLVGATEELGASAGETRDALIRNHLVANVSNIIYCDTVNDDGSKTEAYGPEAMAAHNNRLTPDMVNQAATWLKKCKAPKINGKYVAIIHPSVAYDLRSSEEWIEVHKYANTTEIYNGEIGELHGVRFVETVTAPIVGGLTDGVCYYSFFLGKDAFGIIDAEGGNMEMIVKPKSQAGGPLEQFSTAGYKFEDGTKILYPERILAVVSMSKYSTMDEADIDLSPAPGNPT